MFTDEQILHMAEHGTGTVTDEETWLVKRLAETLEILRARPKPTLITPVASYLRDYLDTMWNWDCDYCSKPGEIEAAFASQNELRELVGTDPLETSDLTWALRKLGFDGTAADVEWLDAPPTPEEQASMDDADCATCSNLGLTEEQAIDAEVMTLTPGAKATANATTISSDHPIPLAVLQNMVGALGVDRAVLERLYPGCLEGAGMSDDTQYFLLSMGGGFTAALAKHPPGRNARGVEHGEYWEVLSWVPGEPRWSQVS